MGFRCVAHTICCKLCWMDEKRGSAAHDCQTCHTSPVTVESCLHNVEGCKTSFRDAIHGVAPTTPFHHNCCEVCFMAFLSVSFQCCCCRRCSTITFRLVLGRRIVLADAVPDPDHGNKASRKYLSLVVDLGNEKRRVVSAIRSIVDVEDAIG